MGARKALLEITTGVLAVCLGALALTAVSAYAEDETEYGDGAIHASSIDDLRAGENLAEIDKPYKGEEVVDGYGRVAGYELNGQGFYYMGGVAFEDSRAVVSCSEDGNVWTIDGNSAAMSDGQLEAFWVADAADCSPTEYVSIGVTAAYGERVRFYESDGSLLFDMDASSAEGGLCHAVIIDVTNYSPDSFWTIEVYEGDQFKSFSKIVLGTIYDSSSPIKGEINRIVLDGDIEGSLEVDGLTQDFEPVPYASLVIDLNGHTWGSDKGATLSVDASDVAVFICDSLGSGVIDCEAEKRSTIEVYSGSSLYLCGGTITRSCDESRLKSEEDIETLSAEEIENSSSGWYVVNNHGNLYVYDGAAAQSSGVYSALVKNGWKSSGTEREDFYDSYAGSDAHAYVYGGSFEGGKYAFKNDSNAEAEIYDGSFVNHYKAAVDNAGDGSVYINGGSYSCDGEDGAELENRGSSSIYISEDAGFEGIARLSSGSIFMGDEEYTPTEDGEPVYIEAKDGEISSYTDHSWDEGTVTTEPACTTKGEMTYTCEACGETYTEEIQILGHMAAFDRVVDPSCAEDGYTVYKCIRDGCDEEIFGLYTDALGHDWGSLEYVESCDGDYYTATCSRCEDVYTEYTGTATHTALMSFMAKEPSCEEGGYRLSVCADCGSYEYIPLDPLGHDYVSYVSISPSCESAGEITYICVNCKDEYTESIDPIDHTYVTVKTDVTCTLDGREYVYCSVCGEVFCDDVYTASGHVWGSWTITREATCTSNAIRTRSCSVCGEADGGEWENSKTDHTYTVSSQNPATCVSDGKTTYKCAYCGTTYTETLSAAGHSYDIYEDDCGVKIVCSSCGDILYTYEIPIPDTDTETEPDEDLTAGDDEDMDEAPSENTDVVVGGAETKEESSKPYAWLIIVCVCAVIIIAVALWLGYRSWKKSKKNNGDNNEDDVFEEGDGPDKDTDTDTDKRED